MAMCNGEVSVLVAHTRAQQVSLAEPGLQGFRIILSHSVKVSVLVAHRRAQQVSLAEQAAQALHYLLCHFCRCVRLGRTHT
jgi:hypothetical protein